MPLRTSYSSRELLHTCERKYQLIKLVNTAPEKEEKVYFCHGHAFGAGVASYMLYGDKKRALYECWLAYWPIIDDENYNAYISCAILEACFFKLDEIRRSWRVATFKGKPAIELSARLNINPEIYDVAFIDLVLQHIETGRYAILENKTTSSRLNDVTPMYKNSSQSIGYSIILDAIAGAELTAFDTNYLVAQQKNKLLTDLVVHWLPFKRSIMDRLNWFLTLGMDIKHLQDMQKMNYFPMRNACQAFNSTCGFFGTCELRRTDVPRIQEPDPTVYDFEFFLDDIVADHIRRVKEVLG